MDNSKNGHALSPILKKLAIGLAILAVLFAAFMLFGFGVLIYSYYRCSRVPVYQAVMTDFEIQTGDRRFQFSEFQEIIEQYGIDTLHCFVFLAQPNRTVYRLVLVGKVQDGKDLSGLKMSKVPMKDDSLHECCMNALKLCGEEPFEEKCCYRVKSPLFQFYYIYKDKIVFSDVFFNPTILNSDEQKRLFLAQFVRKKSTD